MIYLMLKFSSWFSCVLSGWSHILAKATYVRATAFIGTRDVFSPALGHKNTSRLSNFRHKISLKVSFSALILFIVTPQLQAEVTIPGTTDGSFEITPFGSSTYSIPISVSPGIGGIKPILSLQYNSQGGNGLLGVGWGVSGLSAISRCHSTFATDGFVDGIEFDANDRYCLDGQRLIEVSADNDAGNCLDGAPGIQYRTEVESFSRIVACGTQGNGPKYFRVWNKAGLIYEYGTTSESRVEVDPASNINIATWNVNKITDSVGNYLDISYFKRHFRKNFLFPLINIGPVLIESYPTIIQYTGNTNSSPALTPNRIVRFVYENRPDILRSFIGKSAFYVAKRLNKIENYFGATVASPNVLNAEVTGQAVREYRISYKESLSTKRSLLESVTDCAWDNRSDFAIDDWQCLQPTTFTWTDSEITLSEGRNTYHRYGNGGNNALQIDVNGDGIQDLVHTRQGNWRILFGSNTAAPLDDMVETGIPTLGTSGPAMPIDYDLDGKIDVLIPNCTSTTTEQVGDPEDPSTVTVCDPILPGAGDNWVVMRSLGRNFELIDSGIAAEKIGTTSVGLFGQTGTTYPVTYNGRANMADFDGDGLPDMIYATTGNGLKIRRYTVNDDPTQRFVESTPDGVMATPSGGGADYVIVTSSKLKHIADFNGDGKSDFIANVSGKGCSLYFSTSGENGISAFSFIEGESVASTFCRDEAKVTDLNGDGKADIVTIDKVEKEGPFNTTQIVDSETLSIYAGTESGFKSLPFVFASSNSFKYAFPVDFDNDGLTDFVVPNCSESGNEIDPETGETIRVCTNKILDDIDDSALVFFKSVGDDFSVVPLPRNLPACTNPIGGCGWQGVPHLGTARAMDVNGDGYQDIISRSSNYENWGVFINNGGQDQPKDLISVVTTGLGTQNTVKYAPLTDPWQDTALHPNLEGAYNNLPTTAADYPNRALNGPMYVARRTRSSIGGSVQEVHYQYEGGLINSHGRGFLGFNRVEVTTLYVEEVDAPSTTGSIWDITRFIVDFISGQIAGHVKYRTDTTYHQEFPFTGREQQISSYAPNLATVTVNNWRNSQKEVVGQTDQSTRTLHMPYISSTHENHYGESGIFGSTFRSSLTTTYADNSGDGIPYDAYGNPETIVEAWKSPQVTNASPSVAGYADIKFNNPGYINDLTTTTVNHYDNYVDGDRWLLGRLSNSSVTKASSNTAQQSTRYSEFTYYQDNGLLHCTKEEPNAAELRLDTCYEYDDYGNKVKVEITGKDGQYNDAGQLEGASSNVTRTVITEYGVGGTINDKDQKITKRSVVSGTLSLVEKITVDARKGVTISQTGANDLPTTYQYDGFGRKVKETRPDTSYTTTSYHLACDGFCPDGTALITTSQTFSGSGESLPASHVYFDSLLRETRTRTAGFDGSPVCQDTSYYVFGRHGGRKSSVTKAHFCSDLSPAKTTFEYDIRGNVSKVTNPDDSYVTSQDLGATPAGLLTLTQRWAPNGTLVDKNVVFKDALGQVVKTAMVLADDADYQETIFRRDVYGNTTHAGDKPHNDPDFSVTGIVNNYDVRGNRLSMSDPDMGNWQYRYNAFGELKWQKDAKGQITRIAYDALGRMVSRTEADTESSGTVTTYWQYDTAAMGLGKLDYVCKPYVNGACVTGLKGSHKEAYTYDAMGRPQTTVSTIEDQTFDTVVGYDTFSRPKWTEYPYSDEVAKESNRLRVSNTYNPQGYVASVVGGWKSGATKVYWKANDANVNGQVTDEEIGGIRSLKVFNPQTGLLKTISTGLNGKIQNLSYQYYAYGDLKSRTDSNQKLLTQTGVTEVFGYDSQHRLKTVTRNGSAYLSYDYDRLGNITYKSDIGYYTYGENGAGPHAVTSIRQTAAPIAPNSSIQAGDANADKFINTQDLYSTADQILGTASPVAGGKADCTTDATIDVRDITCINNKILAGGSTTTDSFTYDANGNMLRGSGRSVIYTSFNKPSVITSSGAQLRFAYGANRSRITQRALSPDGMRTTFYAGSLMQRVVQPDGVIKYQNFVYAGGRIVATETRRSNNTQQTRFAFTDHLGSVDVITDEAGVVKERFSYDPFGKRRAGEWNDGALATLISDVIAANSAVGDRGFTGHEMLDNVGLIHMNGRVFDPSLGRFMSADPFIQAPSDSQSFNRYSYVLNNPLSATDPSGYFFKKIFSKLTQPFNHVGSWLNNHGSDVIRTGMIVGIGAFLGPACGPQCAAFGMGLASGQDAKGILISMLTATAYQYASGVTGFEQQIIAQGTIGGFSNAMQGGNFFEGFISAAASAGFSPYISQQVGWGLGGQTMVAAIVGGTAAEIGGGKFSNGAITAAFSYLFTEMSRAPRKLSPTYHQGNGGVAFVGGYFDFIMPGPVLDAYMLYPGNKAYFQWYESGALAQWIDANGRNVTVIAHSYGADMAAEVVAAGHYVNELRTVDPVGWTRPNFADVKANSGVWYNYNAVGGGLNFSNAVSVIGGAWGSTPSKYAIHKDVPYDHSGACYKYCSP